MLFQKNDTVLFIGDSISDYERKRPVGEGLRNAWGTSYVACAGALLGSVDVSAGKAYTANAFQMPTHELGQAARPDGPLYGIDASAPGKIVLFGGGFPYVVNGKVVGGIGVSGGTVEQDMDIARYAMSL